MTIVIDGIHNHDMSKINTVCRRAQNSYEVIDPGGQTMPKELETKIVDSKRNQTISETEMTPEMKLPRPYGRGF